MPAAQSASFDERFLWASWPLFAIVLFAGYLKRSGDFVSACKLYEALVANGFSPFEGYMGLADIHHLLANWRKEIQEYKDVGVYPAAPLAPHWRPSDQVWNIDAYSHETAIDLYRKALAIRPDDAFALSQLGRAYLDSGDLHQAAAACVQAGGSARGNHFIKIWSACVQLLAGKGGAAARLKKALRCDYRLHEFFGGVRRVTFRSSQEIAREVAKDFVLLLPEEVHSGTYMASVEGQISRRSFSIRLPAISSFVLHRVREVGLGGKLVDDKIFIPDSKHLGPRQLKMFSPSLMAQSDRAAVFAFSHEVKFYRSSRIALLPPGAFFNYFHFLFEALGALMLMDQNYDLSRFDLVIPAELKDYQRYLLDAVLQRKPRVRVIDDAPLQNYLFGQALHVPFPSRWSVPHPRIVNLIRERLSRHTEVPTKGKRVYLTRQSVRSGRKTVNEQAIASMLSDKGFVTADSGLMTVAEQIEFFRDVEVLVAPAGAALANLVFCPKSVVAVALTTGFHHSEVFTMIASALDQRMILCIGPSQTIPNAFYFWSVLDLEADLSNLAAAVDWAIAEASR